MQSTTNHENNFTSRCWGPEGKGPLVGDWLEPRRLVKHAPRVRADASLHDVVPQLAGGFADGVFIEGDDGIEVGWISGGEIGTTLGMALMHQLPDVTLRSCAVEEIGAIDVGDPLHDAAARFSDLRRTTLPVFARGHCVGDLRIAELVQLLEQVGDACCADCRRSKKRQRAITSPEIRISPNIVGPWLNRLFGDMFDTSSAF